MISRSPQLEGLTGERLKEIVALTLPALQEAIAAGRLSQQEVDFWFMTRLLFGGSPTMEKEYETLSKA